MEQQLIVSLMMMMMLSMFSGLARGELSPSFYQSGELSYQRGELSPAFYQQSCPSFPYIVRSVISNAVANDPRMGASLLRLHFHDCFVNGCDGSILLDDSSSIRSEKNASPNINSARGFEVIDNIKTEVEKACRGVVSCADILAAAANEGVIALQGLGWLVHYGRRDSTNAFFDTANNDLPSPNSTIQILKSKFQAKGLSSQDLVVLSGAHSIGQARCATFRDRLYNFRGTGQSDPTLEKSLLGTLRQQCPSTSGQGDNNLSPLDPITPTKFENHYFQNLKNNKGLLTSDQVLHSSGGDTQNAVNSYSSDYYKFFYDFGSSMIKMGNISPLTGSNGQVRLNCRRVNSAQYAIHSQHFTLTS